MVNVQQAEFVFNKIVAIFGHGYEGDESEARNGDGELIWDNPAIDGVIGFDFITLELEQGELTMSFGLSDLDTDDVFDIEVSAKSLHTFGLRLERGLSKMANKLARRNGWHNVAKGLNKVRDQLCR